uniref:Cadherin n=1 Tax=Schistosoma mansoni TaxID=6183 RepID=A0A5K4F1E2_SCHMA
MQPSIGIDLYHYIYISFILTILFTINIHAQTTRIIRIKENTPIGTVIIPNIINFLYGPSYSSTEHHKNDKNTDYLLAIGNSVMQGANWFAIDDIKHSLYVKQSPDRDILCPNDPKLPDTAVSITNGGIEFPEYNLNHGSNYNIQLNNHNNIDNNDCIIKLSIIHGSSANPSFDLITVILEDINDHAPSFKEVQSNLDSKTNEFIISIPETPTIIDKKDDLSNMKHRIDHKPIRILLPTAIDLDQGVNSIKGYRLEGEDAFHFRLEIGPLINTDLNYRIHKEFQQVGLFQDHKSNRLWLVPVRNGGGTTETINNGELDKEQRSEYHFILVAYDGGSPSKMGKLPIRLIIEDINDHSPEFNQEFYTGRISENDPGGHIIFEFSARDRDNTKENGIVKFRIPGQMDQNEAKIITGQRDRISLTESQLIAAELFSIEYPYEKPNDVMNIQENLHNSTVYGRLIIKRQSKEKIQQATSKAISIARQNQIASGSKLGSNFHLHQSINNNELPSNNDQLHFFIEAYDNGLTPLVTKVPVIILITDVNDHPPEIFISYLKPTRPLNQLNLYNTDRRQIWGKITENLERSMIAQITVIDKDSTLTQSDILCKTNDSRFLLEEINNHHLDRLDDPSTSFWPRNNFYSSNNIDSKTHFIDWYNQNKPLTKMYKLMSISSLDREFSDKQPSFIKFSIICIDNQHNELPGGSLTSQADIFVEIEDTNDNSPVFDHNEYTFHLPENHPRIKSEHNINPSEIERYPIGMVHASDKDGGIHGSVTYKLVSNPSGSIQIDKFNGMLYAVQPFDREAINELIFQVHAIDCTSLNGTSERQCDESLRLTGTTNVRIIIDDLNDSPPVFQEANYHFEVEEGLDLVKVGQVWAVDADQDEAARISYRLAVGINNRIKEPVNDGNFAEQVIKSSNNQNLYDEALEITTHFQIDPRSGLIHLKGRLDRERRAHYEFVVLALDNPRSIPTKIAGYQRQTTNEVIQFTATATVLITVLDHNDNAPRILSPLNHVEFMLSPDQLIAGNTIFTIRATDPDLGENGTIEYKLLQVEDDLGSWNFAESVPRNSQLNHRNTTDTNSQMNQESKSSNVDYPFAVDRTAGICYLRENLPPLNVDGPRAYMLRILAYDLGKPDSLNTTLVIRVARQVGSNADISNGILYSNRINAKEYRQPGRIETQQYLFPSNEHDSESDVKVGTWTSAGQARISDKTMVVILSTVFILLLLTTIVLLLLVRYRRLLIRNIPLEQSLACDGPDSKANEGFAVGKPMSPTQNNLNGFNGFFTEVVTAPWVRGSTSPVVYPTPCNYPTIYNTGINRSRGCIANPNACWSPTTTLCKSPTSNHEDQRKCMQTPTTMYHSSPSHGFRILPTFGVTSSCVGVGNNRLFDSPVSSVNPSFTGLPGGFILQNYSLQDDDDDDDEGNGIFQDITPNNEINNKTMKTNNERQTLQNPKSEQLFSKSLANNLHCQNKVPEPDMTKSFSSLKRTAISLEELNDYKDEINSKNYSRLVRFQLAQSDIRENDPTHNIPISSRNEYQTLTSFHRGDDDNRLLNKTSPLFCSWMRSDQQQQPIESFLNPYDQLNCKTQLKSSKPNNNNNNSGKQNHTTTTNNNNNNNSSGGAGGGGGGHSNNNSSNIHTIFPDIFQLQPLTHSQLSDNHEISSCENLCQTDEFYMSTIKPNKKLNNNNNNTDMIFTNSSSNKLMPTLNKCNILHNNNNNNHSLPNYPTTNECTHNLSNCNLPTNDMNKSSNQKIGEEKKSKTTRHSKMVTLISPKKDSSLINDHKNDTHNI